MVLPFEADDWRDARWLGAELSATASFAAFDFAVLPSRVRVSAGSLATTGALLASARVVGAIVRLALSAAGAAGSAGAAATTGFVAA